MKKIKYVISSFVKRLRRIMPTLRLEEIAHMLQLIMVIFKCPRSRVVDIRKMSTAYVFPLTGIPNAEEKREIK